MFKKINGIWRVLFYQSSLTTINYVLLILKRGKKRLFFYLSFIHTRYFAHNITKNNIPWVEFCQELTLVRFWNPWLKIINIFLSQYCEQKYQVCKSTTATTNISGVPMPSKLKYTTNLMKMAFRNNDFPITNTI